ncbi:hypothetical protein HOL59_05585 [Candidatus Woesearchaeota archaeon]|jgi:hypothetical protein|nr:hypothetical protein [Candidatus Woesearchaeota archaeon]
MDLEEMVKFAKRKKVTKTAYQLIKEEKHQEAYDLLMQSEIVDTIILGDLGQHFLETGEYVEAIDLYTKMGEISGSPEAVQSVFHEHVQGLQKTEDYDGIISISETLLEKGYKMLE